MAEKSEKATPKKLRDARKKGQVAKSQDGPAAATFIASISLALALVSWIFSQISAFVYVIFGSIAEENLPALAVSFFHEAVYLIFKSAIPILLLTACTGAIVSFLLVGPTFAPEAFKPDIKKFDPIKNLKGKFKIKTLVELVKQLLKISGAIYLIFTVVKDSLPAIVSTVGLPIQVTLSIYSSFLLKVILRVGIFFAVVGAADVIYQRRVFAKEMMMEKFEVKQEYKNTEGDPQIKGKRKQLAQEIVYSDAPAAGARQAKAVVTNPTHLAIAIAYDPEAYPLPYICAMGQDTLAYLIVQEAEKHDIPVLRNVSLAHQLYEAGDVWDFIPENTYEPVAEVLRWLASLEQSLEKER